MEHLYIPEKKHVRANEEKDRDAVELDPLTINIDPLFTYQPAQIEELYHYWYQGGFTGIVLGQAMKLMTLGLSSVLCFFVLLCVNRVKLFQTYSLADSLIYPQPSTPSEIFFVFVFSVVVVFWTFYFLMLFVNAYRSWHTKKLFQRIVGTRDVSDVTWTDLIAAVKREYSRKDDRYKLDELEIVNSIMVADNYMMALVNEEKLDFQVPILSCVYRLELVTMALEFGLRRAFRPIFDKIKNAKELYEEDVATLRYSLYSLGLFGLIISPIMAIVVFIFVLFEYGEQFKSSPGQLLAIQDWSLLARYKFRDYNELAHLFEARMKKTYKPVTEFLDNRVSNSLVVFARFVSFQLSSVLVLLVVASFYDPNFLTQTKLIGDLNALVIIGALGTAVGGLRRVIPSERTVYEPKHIMLDLSAATHYYPRRWIGQEHTAATVSDLKKLYPYSILTFFWEMLGIFIAPLQMISMSRNAGSILNYIKEITVQLHGRDFYTKHSCFRKKKEKYQDQTLSLSAEPNIPHLRLFPYKVAQSLVNFKAEYPAWVPPDHLMPFFEELFVANKSKAPIHESFGEYASTVGFETSRLATVLGSPTTYQSNASSNSKKALVKEKDSYSKTLSVLRIEKELNDSK